MKDNSESFGIKSELTYRDLHRAVLGFFRNLEFDEQLAFACPRHGTKPNWIVADGKNMGPTKNRCKNLSEFDRHPEDEQKLPQSTSFKDRVFLPDKKERTAVCALLGEQISMAEFIASPDIASETGRMITNLVQHILQNNQDGIHPVYKRFIQNVCKPTSARGLFQVTNYLPLGYLESYCKEELNLKDIANIESLRTVSQELPVVWQILNDICNFEQHAFLPTTVSRIVLKMLEIRMNSFVRCSSREDAIYIPYEGPEQATMFYPNHKLKSFPKKYKVNQKIDDDLCKKAFIGHSDFTAGIFTIGECSKSIHTFYVALGYTLFSNSNIMLSYLSNILSPKSLTVKLKPFH